MPTNPDYSQSIVNETNSKEVLIALDEYRNEVQTLNNLVEDLRIVNPFLSESIDRQRELIANKLAELKKIIDEKGSYQDVEAGVYALKFRKRTAIYHADKLKEHHPKAAPLVIEESVNTQALQGLIRGKSDGMTIESLEEEGVLTYKETSQYYIS